MKNWKDVKLIEICSIKSGKRLPENHALINEKTGHPYIKARDIRNGK